MTDLFAALERLGIATRTVEHEPVFTVAESTRVKDVVPGGHTKNLFLKDRKGGLFLVVARAEAEIDLKRLHETIGAAGRLSFGSADLLREVLGVEPGSVTPFAVVNDPRARVAVVIDARLMRQDPINIHPLVNSRTTSIGRDDLVRFLSATGHQPRVMELPEPAGNGKEPAGGEVAAGREG